MTKYIIVDRERSLIILDGELHFAGRTYKVGDTTHFDYPGGSSPYICFNVQKLAMEDHCEYSVYRADFCEIHGSGEMSRYFIREEA